MPKTLASPKPLISSSVPGPGAPRGIGWRRALPALCAGAAVFALVGAVLAWRWGQRAVVPAGGPTLPPTEARLLAEAARQPTSTRPYLELAEEYATMGRRTSALWACGEAAARAPSDPAVRLKLAAALAQSGHPRTAEPTLRGLLAEGGATAAQARLDLADLLLSTGRPEAALAALQKAGREAEVVRGRAYEAGGHAKAAARAYRRAGVAGDPEGYVRLARLELAAGHVSRAQEAVRLLGQRRALQPEDLVLIAAIHAAAGTPQALDTALARLERCLQLQPRHVEGHFQRGLLLLRKGDRAAAAAALERAARLEPRHAEARRHLAEALEALGQTARAQREQAIGYQLKGQPDLALAELRRRTGPERPSRDASPPASRADDVESTLLTVQIATDMELPGVAIQEARDGLKRHPGDPQLMLQVGLLEQTHWRVQSNLPARAPAPRSSVGGTQASLEKLCRDWIARQPESGLPYWLLGRRAVNEFRMDDAIRFIETACAREPHRSDFCSALGIAYVAVPTPENLARARPWLEKAITLNPRSPEPHLFLGRVLEQAGDLAGAQREYLQSLDLQPGQPPVLNSLIQVATRLGRTEAVRLYSGLVREEEARSRQRQRLTRRVRERPADPGPRVELARSLIRHGQLTAARDQLERAARPGPAAAIAQRELADVNRLLRAQAE